MTGGGVTVSPPGVKLTGGGVNMTGPRKHRTIRSDERLPSGRLRALRWTRPACSRPLKARCTVRSLIEVSAVNRLSDGQHFISSSA